MAQRADQSMGIGASTPQEPGREESPIGRVVGVEGGVGGGAKVEC